MTLTRRRALHSFAGLASATLLAPRARAQTGYPNGPIRIVIPTAAGGGHDSMMRLVGMKLTEAWGQPVIVESKAGASGAIAAAYVAKAPPDGLTILIEYSAFVSNLVLQKTPGYRLAELAPISMLAVTPIAIGVRSSLGVSTLSEYIALAKREPHKLTYGSYGQGSGGNFIGEQLNAAAGIDIAHVPYKGETPALTDLLGGQIDAACVSLGGLSRYPGKIKPLAVANPTRFPLYQDVSTFVELGLPAVNLLGWGGAFAPAATPKPIVDKLATELNRIILLPELQKSLLELGFQPVGWPPEKLAAFMTDQLASTKRIVDEGRVKIVE